MGFMKPKAYVPPPAATQTPLTAGAGTSASEPCDDRGLKRSAGRGEAPHGSGAGRWYRLGLDDHDLSDGSHGRGQEGQEVSVGTVT